MYERNIKARSSNFCCCGRAIIIMYSECVSLSLVVQHAKGMRPIILSPVACPAVPHFPYYLINGTIFEGKVPEHKMWVFAFSTALV